MRSGAALFALALLAACNPGPTGDSRPSGVQGDMDADAPASEAGAGTAPRDGGGPQDVAIASDGPLARARADSRADRAITADTSSPASPGACTSNAGCPSNQYCRYRHCFATDGACRMALDVYCDATDGFCMPRPPMCNDSSFPVCGCDGKTYVNECQLGAAGVSPANRDKGCEGIKP